MSACHGRELGVAEEELIGVVGYLRHDQRAAAVSWVVGQQDCPACLAVEAAGVSLDSLVHEAADLVLSFDDGEFVGKPVGVEAAGELMTRPQSWAALFVVGVPVCCGTIVTTALEAVDRLGSFHPDLHRAALARD